MPLGVRLCQPARHHAVRVNRAGLEVQDHGGIGRVAERIQARGILLVLPGGPALQPGPEHARQERRPSSAGCASS
jgi:hypothetical protein